MAFFGNKAIEARIDDVIKIIENMVADDFSSRWTPGSDVDVPLWTEF